MVKKNNSIPKAHFKKKWKSNIKTWFATFQKKKKRTKKRKEKDKYSFSLAKISRDFLRPLVHSPTKLHNMKIKIGRGFSKNELSKASISKKDSFSLGIGFDKRRRSKSVSEQLNFRRIENFLERAVFEKKKNLSSLSEKNKLLFPMKNHFKKSPFELKKNYVLDFSNEKSNTISTFNNLKKI